MIDIVRTDPRNQDFTAMVKELDADLAVTDGDEHAFYDQYNKLDKIKHVVVLYDDGHPVSCGAIKQFEPGVMEVKRMFTISSKRGKGYAGFVLNELEKWAAELSAIKCILETGTRQPYAIALYKKSGYRLIPNYGQYKDVENSLCFGKELNKN